MTHRFATLLASVYDLADLKRAIADHDRFLANLRTLVEKYKAGDEATFIAEFEAQLKDSQWDAAEVERLLKERNERWVPAIEEMINEGGKVFIAVGAGHLYGEHGLLRLLSNRGHNARRIFGGAGAAPIAWLGYGEPQAASRAR